MQIVEMTFSDLKQVAVLGEQLGYPFPVEEMQERFLEISKLSTHKLFVAKNSNDVVVGWVHVNKESPSLLSDTRAEISALIVDEAHRGKGIGKALMIAAEKWAIENKLPLMRLRSNTIRTEAHKFYQKQGYAIKKSWYLFVKSLWR